MNLDENFLLEIFWFYQSSCYFSLDCRVYKLYLKAPPQSLFKAIKHGVEERHIWTSVVDIFVLKMNEVSCVSKTLTGEEEERWVNSPWFSCWTLLLLFTTNVVWTSSPDALSWSAVSPVWEAPPPWVLPVCALTTPPVITQLHGTVDSLLTPRYLESGLLPAETISANLSSTWTSPATYLD